MTPSRIKKLFERRSFSEKERSNMRELYAFGELFAQRINETVPNDMYTEMAILKVKGALALCETAVALNPQNEAQAELFGKSHVAGDAVAPGRLPTPMELLEKENAYLRDQLNRPAHARR